MTLTATAASVRSPPADLRIARTLSPVNLAAARSSKSVGAFKSGASGGSREDPRIRRDALRRQREGLVLTCIQCFFVELPWVVMNCLQDFSDASTRSGDDGGGDGAGGDDDDGEGYGGFSSAEAMLLKFSIASLGATFGYKVCTSLAVTRAH